MDLSHLIFGGAIFGTLVSSWGYIKAFAWKICGVFIEQVEIVDTITAGAIVGYLVRNYRRSITYDKTYNAIYEYIKHKKMYGWVSYEFFGKKTIIFWNSVFPFIFNGPGKKDDKDTSVPTAATITFIRGTLDIDKIISEANAKRNEIIWNNKIKHANMIRRFFVRHIPDINSDKEKTNNVTSTTWFVNDDIRLLEFNREELGHGEQDGVKLLDNLIFPERINELIEEIKIWRDNKEWYQDRKIPWKRGWLLYGPPGTGKTALTRALAEDLDMPIFVFNLAEMTNFEFMRAWLNMQQNVPCIALIEDVDNVFHGRSNVSHGRRNMWSALMKKEKNGNGQNEKHEESYGMLNFDVFINCLDGVDKSEGVLTIITTNDITKIDKALGHPVRAEDGSLQFVSSRPGRIDRAIELTYMGKREKKIMAHRILRDYPDAFDNIMRDLDKEETPAQFQERCSQIALAKFWKECKG